MRLSRAQRALLRQMADSGRPLIHFGWGRLWALELTHLGYPIQEAGPSKPTVRALLDRGMIAYSDEPLNKTQINCGWSAAVLTDAGREAAKEKSE